MNKNLITAASYSTALDAHLAKTRLDSAGVFAVIFDEHTVTMNWLFSDLIGGVKIKVLEDDLESARLILDSDETGVVGEDEVQDSWGDCPGCDSKDIVYIPDKRGTFLSWLFLGFPFFPVRERMKCRVCGLIWKYNEVSGEKD